MLETVCVTGSFSPGSRQAELLGKWLAPFKPDDLKQGPLLLLPPEVGVREDRQEWNVYCVGVQLYPGTLQNSPISEIPCVFCVFSMRAWSRGLRTAL